MVPGTAPAPLLGLGGQLWGKFYGKLDRGGCQNVARPSASRVLQAGTRSIAAPSHRSACVSALLGRRAARPA